MWNRVRLGCNTSFILLITDKLLFPQEGMGQQISSLLIIENRATSYNTFFANFPFVTPNGKNDFRLPISSPCNVDIIRPPRGAP